MHWGNYVWGMGFGWLGMIIFWAVVLAVIVFLVRGLLAGGQQGRTGETPLDILKQRYARGEITHDEYARMKEELKKE